MEQDLFAEEELLPPTSNDSGASSESPEPRDLEDDDMDSMVHPPDPSHFLRRRQTTSTEEEEGAEVEDEEDLLDEDEEEEEEREVNGSNGNISFASVPPLSSKDNLIHIGNAYQAVIDPEESREAEADREMPIWDGDETSVEESKLDEYVKEGVGRYGLSIDRCLYILQKSKHNVEVALEECAKRTERIDEWTEVERNLFKTCFLHFGKNFKKIHSAIPERSLHSIIQYYYDTKKTNDYKTTLNCQLDEEDVHDELFANVNDLERVAAGYCENCSENTDFLILNRVMKRHECKACMLYFQLMREPRPASLRAKINCRSRVVCPEFMKPYLANYDALTGPADGKAVERLKLGNPEDRVEHVEDEEEDDDDDDDCMVVDECPLLRPTKPYTVPGATEDDDPVDANTCRMTRRFDTVDAKRIINNIRKLHHLCVPLVWRENETKCMEDVQAINQEARRLMLKATDSFNIIPTAEIRRWQTEMMALRRRFEASEDSDETAATGTSRSGKVRFDSNWTEQEKRDVTRCFTWYYKDFDRIAEVLGTKTPEQIRIFFAKHEETIEECLKEYKEELRKKLPPSREQTPDENRPI